MSDLTSLRAALSEVKTSYILKSPYGTSPAGSELVHFLDDEAIKTVEAIVAQEVRKARKQAASDIFSLAHEYAQDDNTMVGSEELRAYHYYNAIHKIGEFHGR